MAEVGRTAKSLLRVIVLGCGWVGFVCVCVSFLRRLLKIRSSVVHRVKYLRPSSGKQQVLGHTSSALACNVCHQILR